MGSVLLALRRALEGEVLEGTGTLRLPPPVASTVGFTLTQVDEGAATFEMVTDMSRHANPMGTLHGGILCDLADAAMGVAHASTLDEGESFTTLELKMNFLRPVWNERLIAKARVVKGGRTVSLVECDVFNENEALVARASSTVMTLRGEMAKGR